MTRPLLIVTRPAEEAARTGAAAEAAGFSVLAAPLLLIEPLPWAMPATRPEALLFTSARSPHIAAKAYPALKRLPAYAVGARTAEVAAAAGFRVAAVGAGDGSAALALAARDGVSSLLHLAGKASAAVVVPEGLQLVRRAVYAARRVKMLPRPAVDALQTSQAVAVLLFSARTARHFADLFDRSGLDRARVRLVAFSPAVAQAAGTGWRAIAVAAAPRLDAALCAARSLWPGGTLWQGRGDG